MVQFAVGGQLFVCWETISVRGVRQSSMVNIESLGRFRKVKESFMSSDNQWAFSRMRQVLEGGGRGGEMRWWVLYLWSLGAGGPTFFLIFEAVIFDLRILFQPRKSDARFHWQKIVSSWDLSFCFGYCKLSFWPHGWHKKLKQNSGDSSRSSLQKCFFFSSLHLIHQRLRRRWLSRLLQRLVSSSQLRNLQRLPCLGLIRLYEDPSRARRSLHLYSCRLSIRNPNATRFPYISRKQRRSCAQLQNLRAIIKMVRSLVSFLLIGELLTLYLLFYVIDSCEAFCS